METVFFLVYVSSAVKPFSNDELLELLEQSRQNNAKQNITGMLLYKDGNFMQVLEGDQDAVLNLYAKVARDPRHRGSLTMLKGSAPERQFPDWSMGFRNLNSAEVQNTPGFSEFMNTSLTSKEFSSDVSRCQKLLLTFKQSM